jgi:hypothetical protein
MEASPMGNPLTDEWCRNHFDPYSAELAADFNATRNRGHAAAVAARRCGPSRRVNGKLMVGQITLAAM